MNLMVAQEYPSFMLYFKSGPFLRSGALALAPQSAGRRAEQGPKGSEGITTEFGPT